MVSAAPLHVLKFGKIGLKHQAQLPLETWDFLPEDLVVHFEDYLQELVKCRNVSVLLLGEPILLQSGF